MLLPNPDVLIRKLVFSVVPATHQATKAPSHGVNKGGYMGQLP